MRRFAMHSSGVSGTDSAIIIPSDTIFYRVFTANTAIAITVPDGATIITFDCPATYWVGYDTAAVIPTIDSDDVGAERNPGERSIDGITTIYIICATASNIALSFYA